MLTLADYTSPELILPELQSRSVPAVLAEMCHTLESAGRVEEPLAFYNAVVSHEQLSSTALPPGWALPHARMKRLSRLSFAVGRSPVPLEWNPAGGPTVRLVFLFAVPEAEGATYIMLLSALAKLSQSPLRWEALLRAPDSKALVALLRNIPVHQPQPVAAGNRRFQAATV